jgi:hypothetical protein
LIASGNESPSISIKKSITLPPFPQPKHLYMPLAGLTENEGVFSP